MLLMLLLLLLMMILMPVEVVPCSRQLAISPNSSQEIGWTFFSTCFLSFPVIKPHICPIYFYCHFPLISWYGLITGASILAPSAPPMLFLCHLPGPMSWLGCYCCLAHHLCGTQAQTTSHKSFGFSFGFFMESKDDSWQHERIDEGRKEQDRIAWAAFLEIPTVLLSYGATVIVLFWLFPVHACFRPVNNL